MRRPEKDHQIPQVNAILSPALLTEPSVATSRQEQRRQSRARRSRQQKSFWQLAVRSLRRRNKLSKAQGDTIVSPRAKLLKKDDTPPLCVNRGAFGPLNDDVKASEYHFVSSDQSPDGSRRRSQEQKHGCKDAMALMAKRLR